MTLTANRIKNLPKKSSRNTSASAINSEQDKMRALQLFIAGTMHEIQYPMQGVLNCTQLLLDKYAQKGFEYISYKEFQEIMRVIEKMRDQTKHCVETTRRVLEINKRRVGISDSFCNPVKIIHETIQMVDDYAASAHVKIQLSASSKIPNAAISSLELSQILIHIINNAIQSIPVSGGNIKLRISHKKSDKFIRIECEDDGIGISKENLPRIFDPFFTTKERGLSKNTGLGLTIVYSIIQACKGSISVKSDLRKGTQVEILVPIHQ